MTLRLPLLFEEGLDIRKAYQSNEVPLLNNALLKRANEAGLPVKLLAYSDENEVDFLSNINFDSWEKRVRIVRLRNNICHGNLSIFVTDIDGRPGVKGIKNEDIKQEAIKLKEIVLSWADGFQHFLDS